MSPSDLPCEDTTEVDWIAILRSPDGAEHPCTIKEVSASSLTICAAGGLALPETFMIRVVGRQLVFRVKQVWRRSHQIGVLIEKIAKLPEQPQAPAEIDHTPTLPAETYCRLGTRRRYGSPA